MIEALGTILCIAGGLAACWTIYATVAGNWEIIVEALCGDHK